MMQQFKHFLLHDTYVHSWIPSWRLVKMLSAASHCTTTSIRLHETILRHHYCFIIAELVAADCVGYYHPILALSSAADETNLLFNSPFKPSGSCITALRRIFNRMHDLRSLQSRTTGRSWKHWETHEDFTHSQMSLGMDCIETQTLNSFFSTS